MHYIITVTSNQDHHAPGEVRYLAYIDIDHSPIIAWGTTADKAIAQQFRIRNTSTYDVDSYSIHCAEWVVQRLELHPQAHLYTFEIEEVENNKGDGDGQ